jgi:hypothetical protein
MAVTGGEVQGQERTQELTAVLWHRMSRLEMTGKMELD